MTWLAGADLLLHRQRLSRADAGLCRRSRPWRSRRVLQRAARGRRRRRAARGHRAGNLGTAEAHAAHRDPAGDAVERVRCSASPRCGSIRSRIVLLFAAGFFELSFNTMAQALVQLNAPADIRGRVIGLYNMAGLGMRASAASPSACSALRSAFTGRWDSRPQCCWRCCVFSISARRGRLSVDSRPSRPHAR